MVRCLVTLLLILSCLNRLQEMVSATTSARKCAETRFHHPSVPPSTQSQSPPAQHMTQSTKKTPKVTPRACLRLVVDVPIFQHKGRLTNRFCYGKRFFCTFGGRGFTQERFSNFSNNRLFQAEKSQEKPCQ